MSPTQSHAAKLPNENTAQAIAAAYFGRSAEVRRFPTGLDHVVFEAKTTGREPVVVRIARRDNRQAVSDALYWSTHLRALGLPLPAVLRADDTGNAYPFAYIILERLPGTDLGQVIETLSAHDLKVLAIQLIQLQRQVSTLPSAGGYGYATRLNGPFPHRNWRAVVAHMIHRSRSRIQTAAVVDSAVAIRVEDKSHELSNYLQSVPATPFLHDISTKNVLIDGGRLTGIVDVDSLCFGDPLLMLGLIRIALLANGRPYIYADIWEEILKPTRVQAAALDLYSALFVLDFLGELGHRWNRAANLEAEPAYVARLNSLLEHFLSR